MDSTQAPESCRIEYSDDNKNFKTAASFKLGGHPAKDDRTAKCTVGGTVLRRLPYMYTVYAAYLCIYPRCVFVNGCVYFFRCVCAPPAVVFVWCTCVCVWTYGAYLHA